MAPHHTESPATLSDLLARTFAKNPSASFLTDLRTGEHSSYKQLATETQRLSRRLAELGVGRLDRVGYVTRNHRHFFPLLLACAHRGAALVPVSHLDPPADIAQVLKDAETRCAFGDAVDPAPQVTEPSLISLASSLDPRGVTEEPQAESLAESGLPALIVYTSGTTGFAKGVVLTHQNLVAMAETFAGFYRYRVGQRFLSMLPFHHINAPMVTGLACLTAGAHVHLTDPYGMANARSIFSYVEEHQLNTLSLTPSIMASLLRLYPKGTECNIASLEYCLVGTAHLEESLWKRFEQAFGVPCYQGYGLTETTTWATLTPPDERKRYDTAGIPVGCEVAISGESERGEVLVRGPIVMAGYYGRKKLTKKSMRKDWFRTGDLGQMTSDGQLRIVGRIKNIVKRRGVLIYPEEIDSCLSQFDCVTASATVGLPDELAGERLATAVVLNGGSVDAVSAHIRERLARDKWPDSVVELAALPRTEVGKTDLPRLKRLVSGDAAKAILDAIGTYRVRRAESPDPRAVEETLQRSLLAGRPVSFVGYWGVGPRSALASPDRVALDRLSDVRQMVSQAAGNEVQVTLELILTDVHGLVNEIPKSSREQYLDAVALEATKRGLDTSRLSRIWQQANVEPESIIRQADQPQTHADFKRFTLHDQFVRQANARCGDPLQAERFARNYYLISSTENPWVASAYEGSVFFSYNAPGYEVALPRLPIVYWHSTKPGVASKPWFM